MAATVAAAATGVVVEIGVVATAAATGVAAVAIGDDVLSVPIPCIRPILASYDVLLNSGRPRRHFFPSRAVPVNQVSPAPLVRFLRVQIRVGGGVSMHRLADRRECLRRELRSRAVNAFLVGSPTNVRYLTGFTGDSSILLLTLDREIIVSDGRFTTQLEQECPGLETSIRPAGWELTQAISRVIELIGVKQLAFEAASCTVAEYERLRDAILGVSMTGTRGWVETLRRVKDEAEIAEIRASVRCAERAFEMTGAGLRIGDSEKAVADDLEGYLRRCGATGSSFPPIVAVGRRAALPHARPTTTARDRRRRFRAHRLGSHRASPTKVT